MFQHLKFTIKQCGEQFVWCELGAGVRSQPCNSWSSSDHNFTCCKVFRVYDSLRNFRVSLSLFLILSSIHRKVFIFIFCGRHSSSQIERVRKWYNVKLKILTRNTNQTPRYPMQNKNNTPKTYKYLLRRSRKSYFILLPGYSENWKICYGKTKENSM